MGTSIKTKSGYKIRDKMAYAAARAAATSASLKSIIGVAVRREGVRLVLKTAMLYGSGMEVEVVEEV